MIARLYNLALLVLPWLTLFKTDKQTFKRYLPVITFSSLAISLLSELAKNFKWWRVRKPLVPRLSSDISFVFGGFFIANFWVFRLTYGKFIPYMLLNAVFDYMFAYPLTTLGEKLRVYKMGTLSRFNLFLMCMGMAVVNYLYQMFIDDALEPKKNSSKESLNQHN
ncbi:hypothetical protein [Priestia flexa]|uniref:hypothetical protein n=1 Tax=Priestia flexa TaxID=86664 RepID=UPI0032EA92AC